MGGYVVVGQIIVVSYYDQYMPQVLQRSKSQLYKMKMKCRNFSVMRMKLFFKKTSHDQRMLQALQGSKGQLYKMKCRNFTVRVQLINKKFDDQRTPQVLQGLETVQKKLQSFSVMGVKLLVKSLCYLMANISHRLIDTCIK